MYPSGARIVEISRRIDALALERARLVAGFETARACEQDGCVNMVAWLKSHCRLSAGAAMEIVNVAHHLPELPRVDDALEQGEIGFQHAAVIAESAEKLGSDALVVHQAELVQLALESDPSGLRQEVKRVEHQVDQERMRKEAEWAQRSRRLELRTLSDGRVKVDGMLDPEGGAVLKTAVDAAMGRRAKGEERTEWQRRADGLVEVARRCLEGRRLGETAGQRPHLNITVELETLLGLRNDPGRIDGVGPVVRETIERHLCDASVSMTALLDGEVVMAGKERRTFSAPQKRALAARQRTCQFPGCDRPVSWCEGHHLQQWLLGGKTTVDNGMLVCAAHHRMLHEGGWTVERDGAGWRAKAPPRAA